MDRPSSQSIFDLIEQRSPLPEEFRWLKSIDPSPHVPPLILIEGELLAWEESLEILQLGYYTLTMQGLVRYKVEVKAKD